MFLVPEGGCSPHRVIRQSAIREARHFSPSPGRRTVTRVPLDARPGETVRPATLEASADHEATIRARALWSAADSFRLTEATSNAASSAD
jgi:hypothetical protein